ncbi:MAG: phage tail sheath family protein [Candidatus Eremiobacteraeota bacterium]|nr:phage tail sheath family protein [Candidatus Eremiobacteraeota bacterium]
MAISLLERTAGQVLVDLPRSTPAYAVVPSTSGFARNSLVRLTQAGSPVQVRVLAATDAAQNRLNWLNPDPTQRGPREYPVSGFAPGAPLLAESLTYDLLVFYDGNLATLNQGLSLVPEARTYAGILLQPIDFSAFFNPPGVLPLVSMIPPPIAATDVPAPLTIVSGAQVQLTGGQDGLAMLTAQDFVDVGLAPLANQDDVSMLAVPDILIRPEATPVFLPPPPADPCPVCPPSVLAPLALPVIVPELPPIFSDSDILAVQAAMVDQCETLGDRVALIDPPWDTASDSGLGIAPVQAWRDNFDSEFGGLYFPWLFAPDPLQITPTRAIPPSGHIAGLIAATDLSVGVHKAPANADLSWVQDVTIPVDRNDHGVLNMAGIDVIRGDLGRPIRVMGARTVSSDPNWRFINVRRLVCMIRAALEMTTRWVVFEPNNQHTRATLTASIVRFLDQLWVQGALVGATADAAYQVVCNDSNNPPATQAMGQLLADIAIAPSVPFEFVLLRLGRSEDSLDIQERGMIAAGSA